MKGKQVWVSPKDWWWWRVHKPWAERDSVHTQNKAEAIEKAKVIAKNQEAELKIQNKDWKISQSNSYWRDPFPPRDTK